MLDSRELSRLLERWATPRATFVIGGPLGLEREFSAEAGARWSLSALTFPHELARVLVAEQLYRALTIHPRSSVSQVADRAECRCLLDGPSGLN